MKMPFGKHKNERLEDVPIQYLRWCLDNLEDIDGELRDGIEAEVEGRSAHRNRGRSSETPPHTRRALMPAGVCRDRLRELVSAGRKALARKHHPDVGGDLQAMQSVNASADWLETIVSQATEGSR